MWLSLFLSCTTSTDDSHTEIPSVQQSFEPTTLLIHEIWLNPEQPSTRIHPADEWSISIFLFNAQYPYTRKDEDFCFWRGHFSNAQTSGSSLPISISSQLELVYSNCPQEWIQNLKNAILQLVIENRNDTQNNNLQNLYTQQERNWSEVSPYAYGVRAVISDTGNGAMQDHYWAVSYPLNDQGVLDESDSQLTPSPISNQIEGGLRIFSIAPSPIEWFWYD